MSHLNPLQQFVLDKVRASDLPDATEFRGVEFKWDDGQVPYETERPPELEAYINFQHPDHPYEGAMQVDAGEALTAMADSLRAVADHNAVIATDLQQVAAVAGPQAPVFWVLTIATLCQ